MRNDCLFRIYFTGEKKKKIFTELALVSSYFEQLKLKITSKVKSRTLSDNQNAPARFRPAADSKYLPNTIVQFRVILYITLW